MIEGEEKKKKNSIQSFVHLVDVRTIGSRIKPELVFPGPIIKDNPSGLPIAFLLGFSHFPFPPTPTPNPLPNEKGTITMTTIIVTATRSHHFLERFC